MGKKYNVYILASKRNGTLYIGVTNDLDRRIGEHKSKIVEGFTKKYNVDKLVYCEEYNNIEDALKREKQLKKWNRKWKLELIEKLNPEWIDLSTGFPLSRE
ncbi:MAG: GIY-YIG nuclease family protein [Patescibacteria group bacterium]